MASIKLIKTYIEILYSPLVVSDKGDGMSRKLILSLNLTASILLISLSALGHHGAAEYDNTRSITLRGTVTEMRYLNPHVLILFTVKDDKGQAVEWTAESQSPNLLSRRGWSRSTLKPGDQITITGHPVKNGVPAMSAQKIVFADGRATPDLGLPRDSSK